MILVLYLENNIQKSAEFYKDKDNISWLSPSCKLTDTHYGRVKRREQKSSKNRQGRVFWSFLWHILCICTVYIHIKLLKNHITAEACRDLWGVSGLTSLLKQGPPELVVQNHAQTGFEYLQKPRCPHDITSLGTTEESLAPSSLHSLFRHGPSLLPAEQPQRSHPHWGRCSEAPSLSSHRVQPKQVFASASRAGHPAQLDAQPYQRRPR